MTDVFKYGQQDLIYQLNQLAKAKDIVDIPQNSAAAAASAAASAAAAAAAAESDGTAAIAASKAAAALKSLDARHLGAKVSPPALDNAGGALLAGATYWDTVLNGGCLRVFQAGAWVTIPTNVASQVVSTPVGGIVAANVQAALAELDTKKAVRATTLAGYGITDALPSAYAPTWGSITGKPQFAAVATSGSKGDVGLGDVDNTSDASKPVSVPQGIALALKANVADVNAALVAKAGIHSTSMKNRIINGDMRVAQRGMVGSTTAGSYTLDRWLVATTGTPLAWGNPGTGNAVIGEYGVTSLAWEGAAGNTGLLILQRIESKNCSDMAGKVVTVSFFTYQDTGVTRTFTPALVYSGGAADSWSNQVGIQNIDPGTPVPSGVWTKVTNRFHVPTAAITGLAVYPWGAQIPFAAGTQGRLVNVQLEIGDVATPFEKQPFAVQLGLCQYYYRKDTFGHNVVVGTGQAHTTERAYILVPLKGAMRAPPTILVSGGLARLGGEIVGWPDSIGYGPSGIFFNVAWSGTPYVHGDAVMLAATGSFTVTRDAEL